MYGAHPEMVQEENVFKCDSHTYHPFFMSLAWAPGRFLLRRDVSNSGEQDGCERGSENLKGDTVRPCYYHHVVLPYEVIISNMHLPRCTEGFTTILQAPYPPFPYLSIPMHAAWWKASPYEASRTIFKIWSSQTTRVLSGLHAVGNRGSYFIYSGPYFNSFPYPQHIHFATPRGLRAVDFDFDETSLKDTLDDY
ncbi:uncharacterized protein ARMOST_17029 [Armillaria ostoyae]|uniref:Uncharacterized protein n=1 Tax=Armillaria ostoyae TaxID=47428 RepID=A0A284RXV6_ARMOS|nr:uncharacterized protein ARMOST_17029 [Armillaria ostoyae]